MSNLSLQTIDLATLGTVHGGDAMSDWQAQNDQNWQDTAARKDAAVDAAKRGDWGAAGENAVGAAVNGAATVKDLLSPFKVW